MKKTFLNLTTVATLVVALSVPCLGAKVDDPIPLTTLKAGIAKVDITPPIGVLLACYGVRYATGIHDPLNAVVIVFDDGKTRAAIVTLDLVHVLQAEADAIRAATKKAVGIDSEYIIINSSHTHATPWTSETIHRKWLCGDPNYRGRLIAEVGGAAALAASRLRPVSIGYGEGTIDFNVNRRPLDANGKCYEGLNPGGICDHRLKLLRIDDDDSVEPMALITHVVCHANVFRGDNTEISGDFPSIAKTFIEQSFAGKTTAAFLQGCAGDIRSNMPGGNYGRSGSEADITWCGWNCGAETVKVATRLRIREQLAKRQTNFKISAATDVLKLELNEEKYKQLMADRNMPFRDRIENGKIIFPIKVLRIGNIWFVALPGEPVVEYGFKIEKNMEGLGRVFVMGYSGVDAGYIPVERMFDEGGYETKGPYAPSCEKDILNGVGRLVKKLAKEG